MATSSNETEASGNEKQALAVANPRRIRSFPIGHHVTPKTRSVGST